jgi:hypothetical protein
MKDHLPDLPADGLDELQAFEYPVVCYMTCRHHIVSWCYVGRDLADPAGLC